MVICLPCCRHSLASVEIASWTARASTQTGILPAPPVLLWPLARGSCQEGGDTRRVTVFPSSVCWCLISQVGGFQEGWDIKEVSLVSLLVPHIARGGCQESGDTRRVSPVFLVVPVARGGCQEGGNIGRVSPVSLLVSYIVRGGCQEGGDTGRVSPVSLLVSYIVRGGCQEGGDTRRVSPVSLLVSYIVRGGCQEGGDTRRVSQSLCWCLISYVEAAKKAETQEG